MESWFGPSTVFCRPPYGGFFCARRLSCYKSIEYKHTRGVKA